MLPNPEKEQDRYAGRPLLIVLENYILAAINELPADKYPLVGRIVQQVFGGTDDWMLTMRRELRLGDTLDESLRRMWAKNQEIAREQGIDLQPIQFAKMVADQNFADLIGSPIPAASGGLRPHGLCAGEFQIPDDFNQPLSAPYLKDFEGS